jgi:MFS family permease
MSFVFYYGFMGGVGCGINYMIPLVCAWEHFPNHKGLCTGIIVGSYGMGSFLFSLVAFSIVNPNNEKAEIKVSEDLSYFSPEVANRVPAMLRVLVAIWSCLITIAICLISRPSNTSDSAEEE